MSMITIKINPSVKELRIFALLWLVFFLLLAKIALGSPTALLWAAAFTGTCFLISIALNKDFPKRDQLMGLAIPGSLLAIWLIRHFAHQASPDEATARRVIIAVLAAVGVLGGIAIFASKDLGTRIYRGWMFAALPIGWTISHILLGVAFYGVITPIGLIMRALGKDPMARAFDPAATTYWTPREKVTDPGRYFRQF